MRSHTLCCLTILLTLAAGYAIADSGSDIEDLGEPVTLREVTQGSLLYRTTRSDAFLPAPTLETDVSFRVTGMIARAQVRQRFHNPTDRWLEGVYAFPLPEDAAVDGLRMVIGERVVEGEIHERQAAKKIYTQAKKEGKKASLVEQERPNLFTTSVANIGPDEKIDIVIEYQQDLRYDHGRFSLRFPMVVAPRYIPGAPLANKARTAEDSREGDSGEEPAGEEPAGDIRPATFSGQGWSVDTDQVADASRITPPVAASGDLTLNPVFLHFEIDAGLPLAKLDSPSHALHIEPGKGTKYVVELDSAVVPANRDFVLEWEPEIGKAPQAALFTQEHEDGLYTLLMVLPPYGDDAGVARLPRETIFVIDTSGSMQGPSIRQARQALLLALGHLRPEDHFNVIQFNNQHHKLFPESASATDAHLEQAKRYVDGLQANGGTEMLSALRAALAHQEKDLGLRQVIFVTDGSVGNEAALFEHIGQNLQGSRLFTVGIGSAPNSYFMRRAAEHGRGTFTYIGDVGEVGQRMGELFEKLESPVLHDIEITWDDPAAETWPAKVGDLYLREPIQVASLLPNAGTGESTVKVSGWRGEDYWEQDFRLDGGAPKSGVDKLWARKKIAASMASLAGGADAAEVREEVVELALHHHLVSKYTSLVAVDLSPTAPAGVQPDTRPLPVNLPAGWSGQHANVRLPQGATPARLAMLLGALALLAAATLARQATRGRQ